MKKLILLALFILIYPSVIYAGNDEASPAAKSSSGYDPKCWNTHMVDQMAVCSKEHGSCANSCTKKDLKANALCLTECNNVLKVCYKKASADYKVCIETEKQAKKQQETKELEPKATQNKPSEAVNPFNIFAFNPLEIWRNIQGVLDIEQGLPSLLQSSQFLTESVEVPVEIPRPSIAFDPEGKPWDFLPGYVPHESIYLGNTMRISEGTEVSQEGLIRRMIINY